MRYAVEWIKSNPITVISIVVVVLSLGALGWFWWEGGSFRDRLAEREKTVNQIEGFMRKSVDIPPQQPDDPPETIRNVTINPVAIDTLSELHGRMSDEYQRIFDYAIEINRSGHLPLVEGLFPVPTDPALPIEAREEYRRVFQRMLQPWSEDAVLPRLDAGEPPELEVIQDELAELEADFLASIRSPTGGQAQLSEKDQQQLAQEKLGRYRDMLRERAEQLHIYAETDINSPDFPFSTSALALGQDPQPHELWEGQLELWIQQDIAQAIALTNETHDEDLGVLDVPIKRLLRVEVIPGYVGLHTLGGVNSTGADRRSGSSGSNRGGGRAMYPLPAGGLTGSPDQRVSDNFHVGPTGRVSNAIYDVRHARLVAVVDFQRLPELFTQLSRVNFMTVIETHITGVDEYQALEEGYMYGEGDMVQVELIIETIWLREWTEELMPKTVRYYVGLEEPENMPDQQQPFMGPGGMDPFGMDPFGAPMGPPMEPGMAPPQRR